VTSIAIKLENRFRVEGLANVLTVTSFKEFTRKATAEFFRRLKARGEAEIRRLTGLRIRLDVPIGRQIRDFLEAELSRALSKLVVVAGPAGILVNLVAGRFLDPGRIVALVGRELREALRNKGDLDARTRASIAGLDALRRPLNAPKDTPVDKTRVAVRNAQRTLGQTSFLKGDLGRAISRTSDPGRKVTLEALLADLTKKEKDLKRAITLATGRYFLDSQLVGENWSIGINYAVKTLAEAERLAKKLGCTITLPKPPTSEPPAPNGVPTAAVLQARDVPHGGPLEPRWRQAQRVQRGLRPRGEDRHVHPQVPLVRRRLDDERVVRGLHRPHPNRHARRDPVGQLLRHEDGLAPLLPLAQAAAGRKRWRAAPLPEAGGRERGDHQGRPRGRGGGRRGQGLPEEVSRWAA
jgi:hypothetical protein